MTPLARIRAAFSAGDRKAAVALARAEVVHSPSPLIVHALGVVELSIGNLPGARSAFERLAADEANLSDAMRNDWGTTLARMGETSAALEAFLSVGASSPLFAQAQRNAGAAWLALGDGQRAQNAFLTSLSTSPSEEAVLGYGRALAALEKRGDLDQLGHQLSARPDAGFPLLDMLLEVKWASAKERWRLARRLLERNPHHAGIEALALRAGDECGAQETSKLRAELLGRIASRELGPDDVTRCAGWAAQVSAHPSMFQAPSHHATVGGRHSGDLFLDPQVDLDALRETIVSHVQAELRDRRSALRRSLQQEAQIHCWGVELTRGQYQERHFHPEAWMSGCLYLEVPEAVESGGAGGEIYFDTSDGSRQLASAQRGRLLLFPSSLDHGTVPQTCAGKRVSVAFDVIPA